MLSHNTMSNKHYKIQYRNQYKCKFYRKISEWQERECLLGETWLEHRAWRLVNHYRQGGSSD